MPDAGTGDATSAVGPRQPVDPVCGTLPESLNLIIPHAGGVVAATSTVVEPLDAPIAAAPTLAVRGPDGTVWVEAAPEERFGVYRIPPGGPAALVAEGEVRPDRRRLARRQIGGRGDRRQRRSAT